MVYVNVCRAIYDYTAQDDEELSFLENDILYIMDTSDPEWWVAQEKSSNTEEEGRKGLIPSTYVEELPYIEMVKSSYDYEARTEEELSFGENEVMYVFEKDDPDWTLVKLGDKFGFVPSAYLESAEDGESQPHVSQEAYQESQTEYVPEIAPPIPAQQPSVESTTELAKPSSLAIAEDMEYWSVSEVDKKKKKKKGKLGISSQAIFFFSETDKTPVRKWSFNDLLDFSVKTKHVYVEFGGTDAVSFDFHAGGKSEAEKIFKKLTDCKAKFFAAAKEATLASNPVPPTIPTPSVQEAPNEQPISSQNPQADEGQYDQYYQTQDSVQPDAMHELPEPKLAIALYDFEPQNDDELELRADEQVWIVDDFSSDEWWRCKIVDEQGNEREGVVPASYLQLDGADDGYQYDDQEQYDQQQYLYDQQAEQEADDKPPLPPMPRQMSVNEDMPPPLPPMPTQRYADEDAPPPLPPMPNQRYTDEDNVPPPLPPLPKTGTSSNQSVPPALPPKNKDIDPQTKPLPDMPPPLAARPSMKSRKSTDDVPLQMLVNANQNPPQKSRSQSVSKPSPSKIRVWSDRSGSFKVEAEFLGLKDGKIHLHKLNGVKIAVPVEKMSVDDLHFIEELTGKEIPSSAYKGQVSAPKKATSNQSPFDWRDFFINVGVSSDAASKYSSTFISERIDQTILPDLNRDILKDLHIAEGDIIRILKATKSADSSPAPRLKPKRSVSFGETRVIPHPETDHDEELARRIQEEEVHQLRDGSGRSLNRLQIEKDEQLARELQAKENAASRSAGSFNQPVGLSLSGSSGSKLTRKSTRPTPQKSAPSAVTSETIANAQERLKNANTSQGFDDDAWGPNGSITNPEPVKKETPKIVSQPVISSTPISAFTPNTTEATSSPGPKSTPSVWASTSGSAKLRESPIQQTKPIVTPQAPIQQISYQQSPQPVILNNYQQSPQSVMQNNYQLSPQPAISQNNFQQSPQAVTPQSHFQQAPQSVVPQSNFQQAPQPLPQQTFKPVNIQASLPPPLVPTPNNSLPRAFVPTRAPENRNQMDNPFGNSAAISKPPPRPSVEAKGSSIFPQPANTFRPNMGDNRFQNNNVGSIFPKPGSQQLGSSSQNIFPKPAPLQPGGSSQNIFPKPGTSQQFGNPNQNIFPKPAANLQSNTFSSNAFATPITPQQSNNSSQNIFPKSVGNSNFSQPLSPQQQQQQNQSIFPKTGGTTGIFNNSPQSNNNGQSIFPKPSPQILGTNTSQSIFPKPSSQSSQIGAPQNIFPKAGGQAQNPTQSMFPRPSSNMMLQPTNNNFKSSSPMFQNNNSVMNTGNLNNQTQFNSTNRPSQFTPSVQSTMTPTSGVFSSPAGGMNNSNQLQQSSFAMGRPSNFASPNNMGGSQGNLSTGFGNQLAIMGSQDLQRSASSSMYGGSNSNSNDKYAAFQQINSNSPSVFTNSSQNMAQHQFQQQTFTQTSYQQQNLFMSQQQGQFSTFSNNMQGNNMGNAGMNGVPNTGNNFFPGTNQQNPNMNRNNFY